MKTIIAVLIVLSFIQTATLDLDLVLIILISRAYIKSQKSNFYLAFTFGLFIDFLNLTPLGIQSLIYLMLISITEGLSKSRLAGNFFMIIPLVFLLTSINHTALSLVLNSSIVLFPKIIYESLLSVPIFYLMKFWEERFIATKDIKLKI